MLKFHLCHSCLLSTQIFLSFLFLVWNTTIKSNIALGMLSANRKPISDSSWFLSDSSQNFVIFFICMLKMIVISKVISKDIFIKESLGVASLLWTFRIKGYDERLQGPVSIHPTLIKHWTSHDWVPSPSLCPCHRLLTAVLKFWWHAYNRVTANSRTSRVQDGVRLRIKGPVDMRWCMYLWQH